MFSSHETL